jgi:hypothetical protein
MNIKHHLNNSANDDSHMQTPNTFPPQINTKNNISKNLNLMIFLKILLLNLVVVVFVMKINIRMNFQIYKITNINTNL